VGFECFRRNIYVILILHLNLHPLLHYIIKKPVLRDLIPEGYVDFHSHLLPGIDDGSKSDANTLELVSALKDLRFDHLITTPHVMKNVWDNTFESITKKYEETHRILQNSNSPIPFKAAAEYLLDGNFIDLIKSEGLLTLKENYVLVEMSYINPPIQLYDILFDLQVAGYKPVLAHPERYIALHHDLAHYQKLKHAGCALQLNLLSTVGYYGEAVAKTAKNLLKKGMIDYVSSDVHHLHHVKSFSRRLAFKDTLALNEAIANNAFFRF